MDRKLVYEAIDSERDYQDNRWPGHDHEPAAYLIYMQDYLTQAIHQMTRDENDNSGLDTIRKIVALGVACLEKYGVSNREKF